MRLYEGFTKTKTAILLVVLVLYGALVAYSGGKVWEIALFALVVFGYVVLPGVLAAKVLRVKKLVEGYFGPVALLLGTGFFAVLYCFAMRLHILWLLHVLPPVLSVFCLALLGKEYRAKLPEKRKFWKWRPQPQQWMLILLFAALLLLFTFAGVIKYGRPLAIGNTLLNDDMLWNVGNANSFKITFPPQDIRFFDVRLHYHYLTEMVAGALSIASGISAYNIVGFYMQPLMLAALVLCLYRFGRVVWQKGVFKPLLFTYSLFLFSCASLWKILPNGLSVFWNANIMHLITNINSQTTAVLFLCIFCGLFIGAARKMYKVGVLHHLLIVCAFLLLCFAKGPSAALVAVGVLLTVFIGLFRKKAGWRGLLLGFLLAGLFVVIYATMFSSGANNSVRLNVTATLEMGWFGNFLKTVWDNNYYLWLASIPVLYLLQSFLMMPAQFPLFVRGLAKDIRHFPSLSQERMLFNALAIGGTLAYFLFTHPAMSQSYFLYTAIFFVNILAVDAVDFLRWPAKKAAKSAKKVLQKGFVAFVAVFAAAGVATTAFLYVHIMGSGARQLARNLGFSEKYGYLVIASPDDEEAMLWLRGNSPKDAMFATNRTHSGDPTGGVSNLYSAFCERQGYMEGFTYAETNMGVDKKVVDARRAVNDALFDGNTPPEEVLALCQENGIDYLVFSTQFSGSEEQMTQLEQVFTSPFVRIYKVPQA